MEHLWQEALGVAHQEGVSTRDSPNPLAELHQVLNGAPDCGFLKENWELWEIGILGTVCWSRTWPDIFSRARLGDRLLHSIKT